MNLGHQFVLDQAERDDSVRAIVVTGPGRVFCSGADSRALEGHLARGAYDSRVSDEVAIPGYSVRPELDADFAYYPGLSKPVIAAANGAVADIGLVFACFADLCFAAAGAEFTTTHGKLNLPAELGLSWLLPRMIVITRTNECC
jgi:enoyl-CoA hydratase/carnithine racemase